MSIYRYEHRWKWGGTRISFREACRSKLLQSDLQRVHGLLPAIYVRIEEAELMRSVSAAQGFSFRLTMNWKFVFSPL